MVLDLKWQLFFYIALFTGARRGEIVSLLWSDIDFSLNTIHFSKSTAVVKGEVIHKDTKTYATRQCIVPDIVIAAAKKLMHEQQELVSDWVTTGKDPAANNFKTISSLSGMMALRCIFAAPERSLNG